jgi:hypothetical protein
MGAKYDSGLYDANDLASAYIEGYDDALHKAVLKVKVSCPWCSHCLVVTAHQFVSLPTVIRNDRLVVRKMRNYSATSDSNKRSFIRGCVARYARSALAKTIAEIPQYPMPLRRPEKGEVDRDGKGVHSLFSRFWVRLSILGFDTACCIMKQS